MTITNQFAPVDEEVEVMDAEALATLNALTFMSGIAQADQEWVRDMGLSVEHLTNLHDAGFISSDFNEWYPFLRSHFWGVRRNELDFFLRFIDRPERTLFIRDWGSHDWNGHAPENLLSIAQTTSGMETYIIHQRMYFFMDIPVPLAARTAVFNSWMQFCDSDFDSNPCALHQLGPNPTWKSFELSPPVFTRL